ncbi:hypothetical protein Hanom_Chr04g00384791 [Helianthus anomalus]
MYILGDDDDSFVDDFLLLHGNGGSARPAIEDPRALWSALSCPFLASFFATPFDSPLLSNKA